MPAVSMQRPSIRVALAPGYGAAGHAAAGRTGAAGDEADDRILAPRFGL